MELAPNPRYSEDS